MKVIKIVVCQVIVELLIVTISVKLGFPFSGEDMSKENVLEILGGIFISYTFFKILILFFINIFVHVFDTNIINTKSENYSWELKKVNLWFNIIISLLLFIPYGILPLISSVVVSLLILKKIKV